jgi:oligopeptide/dipeptide ABC transporter ATP-binding protein
MSPLLEIENLSIQFHTDDGRIKAVDGIGFAVHHGEILGLVGESGSGKSVTALAILGLIRPPGRIVSGSIRFEGQELLGLPEETMRHIRGTQIAMIFQQPRTALNPVLSVGRQIARLYELHQKCSRSEAWQRTLEMLQLVGIPEPERRAAQYAHQLSGGMCQRVMIAMAVATSPRLLLADEPTTGLDVSIAAQILDLLRELGQRTGASILLITHDLGVVAGLCDRVVVMHAGQVVEYADVRTLFRTPLHPYTRALVRSVPRVDREVTMEPIPGNVPSLLEPPPGCRYASRCPLVTDRCRQSRPAPLVVGHGHVVACYAVEEADATAHYH